MIKMDEALVSAVCDVAREAGRATLQFYGGTVAVERKGDDSPLTAADKAAHTLILEALRKLTPGVPVLSEESSEMEVAERRKWDTFWLVDPLDGTKEFIKGTGEFTVNIALVSGSEPVLGVVHVPVRVSRTGAAREPVPSWPGRTGRRWPSTRGRRAWSGSSSWRARTTRAPRWRRC